jgi:hypothetical protein
VPGLGRSEPRPASEGVDAARLAEILEAAPHIERALRAAADAAPPDWLLCAGAIRDAVWDTVHGREPAMARDLDLAYFDAADLTDARDAEVLAALRSRAPELPWDARNQAAVHLWYPARFGVDVEPFASAADAIATFPETASCVGVRLASDGDLHVVAPFGLEDLLGGVCRHNPTRVSAAFYEERVASKRWRERWPDLRFAAPGLSSRSVRHTN